MSRLPSTSSSPPPPLDHMQTLDGLRGIAILLVLLHNLDVLDLTASSTLFAHGIKELFFLGWVGVQLFFVLSGYLITRGLLATNTRPDYFRNFYIKRSLRIFPLYYAALLMLTLVLPSLWPDLFGGPPRRSDGWLWVYLSNWTEHLLGLGGGDRLPHFWSLAVEEQFYLVWPLLLWRRTASQTLALSGAVVLLGPVLRWMAVSRGYSPEALYEVTLFRMDALAIGAALAAWQVLPISGRQAQGGGLSLRGSALGWLLGSATIVLTAITSNGFQRAEPSIQVSSYSLLAGAFALLLRAAIQDLRPLQSWVALLGRPSSWALHWPYIGLGLWQSLLRQRWLRAFGKYSYALYVFHKPLHDWLGEPMLARWTGARETPSVTLALLYLVVIGALTFGAALLSWVLLEQPLLKLKDRWTRNPSPTPPARLPPSAAVMSARR